jgi:hypothetical protein
MCDRYGCDARWSMVAAAVAAGRRERRWQLEFLGCRPSSIGV